VNQLQADDLHNFGRLLLCLACQSPTAASPQSLNKSMAHVGSSFSSELQQLLLLLLSPPVGGVVPTVQDALMVCSGRMMSRMAQIQWTSDALTSELTKEMENGRFFRLLAKLSYATEQPADDDEGESDRQLLRMLRDSMFQHTDEAGGMVVEMSQVVNSLNKLDVGYEAKCHLASGDGNSLLVASHKELKTTLDRRFESVTAAIPRAALPPKTST